MSVAELERAESLFFELVALPAREREGRLAACRVEEPNLAEQVAMLLAAHDQAEGFLRSGELHEQAAADETLPANSRIGDYTILGVLGSGGMGVVYVAQQERPRRTVALKLIRRGLGGRSALRRFEHEAEILGRLQHPGIAQIYEAGVAETGDGPQPFIAMELVSGPTLTEHARRRGLDARARLALLAECCDAVAHAHQRGIIHRDLKPANILVDETAPSGRPKILDFGIARVTAADLRANTLVTGQGQLMGTLPYMSPEQFGSDAGEIDTRADVYALGVILHELLAGELPLDLRGKTIAEAATIVRDRAPQRLGAIDRELRGDVETIVLKALEKDKSRRYQSAADLGADIRRFLAGEAIEAKRDSAMYVLRKQMKRYRGAVTVAVAFVLALIVFAVVVSVQLQHNLALARAEEAAKLDALTALDAARLAQKRADETSDRLRAELAVSNLEQGRLLGRTGNLGTAEDLIWPEYLRDPESPHAYWALWELYWRQPCIATFTAHEGRVMYAAYVLGGTALATLGRDGTFRLWDARSFRPLLSIPYPGASGVSLAVAPDGDVIAAGFSDGTVCVWELPSGTPAAVFQAASGPVRGLAFSTDGMSLIRGGPDGVVRIWTALGEGPARELPSGAGAIAWLVTGPGGSIAISSANDRSLRYWPAPAAGKPHLLGGHAQTNAAIAMSPDGRTLASGSADRLIKLWDLQTLRESASFAGHNGHIRSLSFSRDGASLVSTGFWSLDVWDVATRRRRRSMPVQSGVPSGAMSPDGRVAVCGGDDGIVRAWNMDPENGLLRLGGHAGRVDAEFSPCDRLIATGDEDGRLRLWDAQTGERLAELSAHDGRIRTLQFHPSGRLLATAGNDLELKIWDLSTGLLAQSITGCDAISPESFAFSSDGALLAYARPGGEYVVVTVPGGSPIATLPSSGEQSISLRFVPGDGAVLAVDRSETVRLWHYQRGTAEPLASPSLQSWTSAFTPDGARMVTGTWGRTVDVWDFAKGERLGRLRGHNALIVHLAVNPAEPGIVASASYDGTLRLWDITRLRPLAAVELFGGWDVTTVAWNGDGHRLVAAGAEGSALVIDLDEFDRRIAGNALYQIGRLEAGPESLAGAESAAAWAERTLRAAPPGQADSPANTNTSGVDPAAVRRWGASLPQ